MDKAFSDVFTSYHQYAFMQKIPQNLQEQTTTPPPESVGLSFSADIRNVEKQLTSGVRKSIKSYISTCIIEVYLCHCVPLIPLDGPQLS